MKTKDLNKLIKKKNIPKERAKELKAERRTLKNRGYAANCRVKRETEEESLKRRINELEREYHARVEVNNKIKARNEELNMIYNQECEEEGKLLHALNARNKSSELKRFEQFRLSDDIKVEPVSVEECEEVRIRRHLS